MSWEFFEVRQVTGRKVHRCEQCGKPIEVGETHHSAAGKLDGDFQAYREHLECREAWLAIVELVDADLTDGCPFLWDWESAREQSAWLASRFPIVAERLGWAP